MQSFNFVKLRFVQRLFKRLYTPFVIVICVVYTPRLQIGNCNLKTKMAAAGCFYRATGSALSTATGSCIGLRSAAIHRCIAGSVTMSTGSSSPRTFATTTKLSAAAGERSYGLVVLGGGTIGCAMASKFSAKFGKGRVAVVEPTEVSYCSVQSMSDLEIGRILDECIGNHRRERIQECCIKA